MTKRLFAKKNQEILAEIVEARSFSERLRGLMFRSSWPAERTLWIHRCNSIHTFFVRFDIDAVFVDRNLIIKKIYHRLPPRRVTFPIFSAKSVFEFSAGEVEKLELCEGDELYVGE